MIPRDATVLAALSGGPDSCALAHALCALRKRQRCQVVAAHVHHGLRGQEADADAAHAAAVAASLGVPFAQRSANVRRFADENKLSLETAAREVRYHLLADAARELGADLIATGHTANDQAETVLMNLLRGSGLDGLAGIAPVRDNIIRPLLRLTRDEVLAYCEANSIAYRVDSSNRDLRFTRNRIRHEALPLLRQIQPNVVQALARLADVVQAENALISQQTERALEDLAQPYRPQALPKPNPLLGLADALTSLGGLFPPDVGVTADGPSKPNLPQDFLETARKMRELAPLFDEKVRAHADYHRGGRGQPRPAGPVGLKLTIAGLLSLPLALQRRVLRAALSRLRGDAHDLEWERIGALIELAAKGRTGAMLELPGGWRVERTHDALIIAPASAPSAAPAEVWDLPVPGEATIPELGIAITAHLSDDLCISADPNLAVLDAAAVDQPLVVRTPRRDDSISPLGMGGGSYKLRDFFIEAKVPRSERPWVPVVAEKDWPNHIVWVVGHRINEHCKVTEETRRTVRLEVKRLMSGPEDSDDSSE